MLIQIGNWVFQVAAHTADDDRDDAEEVRSPPSLV